MALIRSGTGPKSLAKVTVGTLTAITGSCVSAIFLSPEPILGQGLGEPARRQIQVLLTDKESRTQAQRKIDSNLLHTARQKQGISVAPAIRSLETGVEVR